MITLNLVLVILALVMLALASLNVALPTQRVNIGWLGLFFWLLSTVIHV